MDGKQLKMIIERSGMKTKDFAERMGILPQSLNSIFNSSDIKSGTLEKVAEILEVPVASLYGGNVQITGNVGDGSNVNVIDGYDALRKRDEQIDRLLTIIENMQHNGK